MDDPIRLRAAIYAQECGRRVSRDGSWNDWPEMKKALQIYTARQYATARYMMGIDSYEEFHNRCVTRY